MDPDKTWNFRIAWIAWQTNPGCRAVTKDGVILHCSRFHLLHCNLYTFLGYNRWPLWTDCCFRYLWVVLHDKYKSGRTQQGNPLPLGKTLNGGLMWHSGGWIRSSFCDQMFLGKFQKLRERKRGSRDSCSSYQPLRHLLHKGCPLLWRWYTWETCNHPNF